MRGLIYKDLIAFFRKTHIVSWIFDIVFICVFIFAIPGAGAVPTYLLLVQPINMSGAASTLKELDTNYSGRFALTLPATHSQQVLSRFVASYLIFAIHLSECVIFALLHYFIKGQFDFSTYLFYLTAGILIGVILTAVNTLSSFIMGLNATAVMYLLTVLIVGAFYVLYWLFDINLIAFLNLSRPQMLLFGTATAAVIFVVSYLVSKKIYLKKIG